jgi:3-hydroxymyristoyl/3-hydroxydecanoyl-(acyl carrier protein) dehydratase
LVDESITGLDQKALLALRLGDVNPLGSLIAKVAPASPLVLPDGLLGLIDRATRIEQSGGVYGKGFIKTEVKVDPQAWYLTSHFKGDEVMPGTLMYDGCLQTLRLLLLSRGWLGPNDSASFQPPLGLNQILRCRGQVTPQTKTISYEVHLKDVGVWCPSSGEYDLYAQTTLAPDHALKKLTIPDRFFVSLQPYAVAEAIMFADDRPIVEANDIGLRLQGIAPELMALFLPDDLLTTQTEKTQSKTWPNGSEGTYGPDPSKGGFLGGFDDDFLGQGLSDGYGPRADSPKGRAMAPSQSPKPKRLKTVRVTSEPKDQTLGLPPAPRGRKPSKAAEKSAAAKSLVVTIRRPVSKTQAKDNLPNGAPGDSPSNSPSNAPNMAPSKAPSGADSPGKTPNGQESGQPSGRRGDPKGGSKGGGSEAELQAVPRDDPKDGQKHSLSAPPLGAFPNANPGSVLESSAGEGPGGGGFRANPGGDLLANIRSDIKPAAQTGGATGNGNGGVSVPKRVDFFDKRRLLEMSVGRLSKALGPLFSRFDKGAFVARLPKYPFDFIDQAKVLQGRVGVVEVGTKVEATYFIEEKHGSRKWILEKAKGIKPIFPYAAINEIALQSCGFLSSYMGSALSFHGPMRFRNLGGKAISHKVVDEFSGKIVTTATLKQSSVGPKTHVQKFEFSSLWNGEVIYQGQADFGFHSPESFYELKGLPAIKNLVEELTDPPPPNDFKKYPTGLSWPEVPWRGLNEVQVDLRASSRAFGRYHVDKDGWFFTAHFPQDPVWPGSLGLECFIQTGKVLWAALFRTHVPLEDVKVQWQTPINGLEHRWLYRGQVIPTSKEVYLGIKVTKAGSDFITFKGLLWVDNLPVYQINDFSVRGI